MSAMSAKGVQERQELQMEKLPTYRTPTHTYCTPPKEAKKLQFGIVHGGTISGGGGLVICSVAEASASLYCRAISLM